MPRARRPLALAALLSCALAGLALEAPGSPAQSGELPLMSPFPRVEVTGYPVRRGAVLDEVIVRAGRGASVTIDCRGRGCPYGSRFYFMRAAGLRLVSLKQRYRSGAVIELRVTRPRRTGKFVRVTIRSPGKPLRFNACVRHGDPTPVAC